MEASIHSTSSSLSAYLSMCHTQSLNDHQSCYKPWDFLLFHALTVWVQPDPLTSSWLSFFAPNIGHCAWAAIHGQGRDIQWFLSKLVLQMLIFKMCSLTQSKQGCDRYGYPVPKASITNTAQQYFLQMLLAEVSEPQATTALESWQVSSTVCFPCSSSGQAFSWILSVVVVPKVSISLAFVRCDVCE